MLESSGQLLVEFSAEETCGDCAYSGKVDAWADPELDAWGWECPSCKTEHIFDSGELFIVGGSDDEDEWYVG